MLVLYSSDLHLDPKHLERLLEAAVDLRAEALIIGGDLIPTGGRTIEEGIASQRRWVKDALIPRLASFRTSSPQVSVFLDFGNDDLAAARAGLEERDGGLLHLIHGRVLSLDDAWALAGYMFIPPTPFMIKDWEKADCHDRTGLDPSARTRGFRTHAGEERPCTLTASDGTIEDDLERLGRTLRSPQWRDRPFILVTHCPPFDTALDRIADGRHVGSLAIRRFIEQWGPGNRLRLSLHGHIHESPWVSGEICDRIGGVPCYNVGQKRGELRGLLVDLEDIDGSARPVVIGDKTATRK